MTIPFAASLVSLVWLGAPAQELPLVLAEDFQVNSFTTGDQVAPAVAVAPDGSMFVVWQSDYSSGTDYSGTSIQGRRFAPDGCPLTEDFQVNTSVEGDQVSPSVAVDGAGNAVVVWLNTHFSSVSVRGQTFLADGSPSGGEFVIWSASPATQSNHVAGCEVGMANGGGFVVVLNDGYSFEISMNWYDLTRVQARVFRPDGQPVAPAFNVATATAHHDPLAGAYVGHEVTTPALAVTSAGDFVVVWADNSNGISPGSSVIDGHRYLADGTSMGGFTVRSDSSPDIYPRINRLPSVATSNGRFVVVWDSSESSGTDPDRAIQARVYEQDGTPIGPDFQVNTFTSGGQSSPRVTQDFASTFFVAWRSAGSAGSDHDGLSVQAQSLTLDGTPIGGEEQVNSYVAGDQSEPHVAPGAAVWTSSSSPGSDTSGTSIQGRRWIGWTFQDLRAWWRGDGNGDDSSGYGNDGTLVGVGFDWGVHGNALAFEATAGTSMTVADHPALRLGTGDYSISLWIRTSQSASWWPAVLDKRGGEPARGYEVYLANGRVGTEMADSTGATNFTATVPEAYVDDGNFHFVCIAVDRDQTDGGHVYVDGQSVLVFDPTGRSDSLDSDEQLTLGRTSDAMGGADFFDGVLDEVRIWSRALSAREVTSLFLAGGDVIFADGFELSTTDRWSSSVP